MTNEEIKQILIENNIQISDDEDMSHVYKIIQEIIVKASADRDLHRQHVATMVCNRIPGFMIPKEITVSSMLSAVTRLKAHWANSDAEIKRLEFELAHTQNQLDAVCDEGCTPADAKKLREINHNLAIENAQLKAKLAKI